MHIAEKSQYNIIITFIQDGYIQHVTRNNEVYAHMSGHVDHPLVNIEPTPTSDHIPQKVYKITDSYHG
jgi:hypothetical protein